MRRLRNIVLTGFSGTGKSKTACEAARILGWESVDTDADIVRLAGKEIAEIFSEKGEEFFRSLEKEALRLACAGEGRVIATGGGALMDEDNRRLLFGSGLVVGLEARPETIYQRLSAEGQSRPPEERPMLAGDDPFARICSLKAARQPFYSLAHWVVQTDELSEEQVAAEVVRAWQMLGGRMDSPGDGDPELASVVTHSRGSCPIRVGWGLLDRIGEQFRKSGIGGPVYIITDDNVFPLYGRQVQRSLQRAEIEAHCFIIPAGEESKSWETANAIYRWLASRRVLRPVLLRGRRLARLPVRRRGRLRCRRLGRRPRLRRYRRRDRLWFRLALLRPGDRRLKEKDERPRSGAWMPVDLSRGLLKWRMSRRLLWTG